MEPDFSELFHQSSKDHRKGQPSDASPDPAQWPDEWKTIYYKAYPRFKMLPLSEKAPEREVGESLTKRASSRELNNRSFSKDELGTLLKYALGTSSELDETGRKRRTYPSAGARYAIETYLFVQKDVDDIKPGIYHYNVAEHGLDVLPDTKETFIDDVVMYEWAKQAPVLLIFTGVFWRMQNKYGERGYRYVLFEAGHMSQNVHLVASALDLSCCALAGIRDENVEQRLGIDGVAESALLGITLGA